ncbi:GPP34 family phosphoprotein [Micrococcales bacterium 31B]|nr:GPP34 family phosphoprotein [Micrococcales bacterium 31B]
MLAHEPHTGTRLSTYTDAWVYKACAVVDLVHFGHVAIDENRLRVQLKAVNGDDDIAAMMLHSLELSGEPLDVCFVVQDLEVGGALEDVVLDSLVRRGVMTEVPGSFEEGRRVRAAYLEQREQVLGLVQSVLREDVLPDVRLGGLIMLMDYFHVLPQCTGMPRRHYERALLKMRSLDWLPARRRQAEAVTRQQLGQLQRAFTDAVVCAAG